MPSCARMDVHTYRCTYMEPIYLSYHGQKIPALREKCKGKNDLNKMNTYRFRYTQLKERKIRLIGRN